jgi:hypothetical protein
VKLDEVVHEAVRKPEKRSGRARLGMIDLSTGAPPRWVVA